MKFFCRDAQLNISSAYLRPGFAFGGSCLPKEVKGFLTLARDLDVPIPALAGLLDSNEAHIKRAYQLIARDGRKKIALFGLAFKPGTDDMRDSPLVTLAEQLLGKGFDIAIYDDFVKLSRLLGKNKEFIDREIPHLDKLLRDTPEGALDGAEVIVVGHADAKARAAIVARAGNCRIVDLSGYAELKNAQSKRVRGHLLVTGSTTASRPRLAFISPVFLFPNDAGGKIRTTNVLRGLKGGAFDITLVSVASPEQQGQWASEIDSVCDRFISWRPAAVKPKWLRALDLLGDLPVNISVDRTAAGLAAVKQIAESGEFDLIVFDFVHSAVLWPDSVGCASVCFTHNVEAEIFKRHAQQASNAAMRWMWSSQYTKMERFERDALRRFTSVIAVSDRDAQFFTDAYGIASSAAIPTGVDLDFFSWREPPAVDAAHPPTVVFTGSMNWAANIDGIHFFLKEVWPGVLAARPDARFQVVGRNPPASLVSMAGNYKGVEFTGFVDDVRPYVHAAHAFVIPLLVGGGTRIKAFEAMAMGCPVVSTSIGMEGLDVAPDEHYLREDESAALVKATVALLTDAGLRNGLSHRARECVEDKFGHRVAAQVFEQICLNALALHRAGSKAK